MVTVPLCWGRTMKMALTPFAYSKSAPSSRLLNFSQPLFRDCIEQAVRDGILALRRGPIRYRRNSMIVCEGDPADCVFLVVKGTVRNCRTYQDGSRGIAAFIFPVNYLAGAAMRHTRFPRRQ